MSKHVRVVFDRRKRVEATGKGNVEIVIQLSRLAVKKIIVCCLLLYLCTRKSQNRVEQSRWKFPRNGKVILDSKVQERVRIYYEVVRTHELLRNRVQTNKLV